MARTSEGPGRAPGRARSFRLAEVAGRRAREFHILPDAAERAAIAADLGLIELPSLSFRGTLAPAGKADVVLTGRLEAEVVQACIVSLVPVRARIGEEVRRRYVADLPAPEPGGETEMPEDDTIEPMPERLELSEVMHEALALALPEYPRAPGVELGEAGFGPRGAQAPEAPDAGQDRPNPFAALARLRPSGPPGREEG
jgi:uncharacterized metal-binding protein YceD (DUF177 family)